MVKEVLEKIDKAEQHVVDLCEGKAKWTMRVPVDEKRDSDCIIMGALTAMRNLLNQPCPYFEPEYFCKLEAGMKEEAETK